jgi:sphingolipid 8-(E)-desaturase
MGLVSRPNIRGNDEVEARVATASISTANDRLQKLKTLTRHELAKRIADGETLVLHKRRIYKLDRWLANHPGGELAILHFVGRDATDEIEAYHCDETLKRMRGFCIAMLDEDDWEGKDGEGYKPLVPPVQLGYRSGKLDHPDAQWTAWKASEAMHTKLDGIESKNILSTRPQGFPLPPQLLEPPLDPPGIDPARERAISEDYRKMHDQVKSAGLYELQPTGYMRECARYITLALLAAFTWSKSYYLLSSFFLGLFWHQLTFTAHDAGHSGITHSHFWDRLIGSVIANYIGGLSIGWWCDNHDVHHLVTNHPEHDPDIQHMPFFAISPKFLVQTSPSGSKEKGEFGLWSSYYRRVLAYDLPSRIFLTVQHKIYYVVMSLGRFNLYANSYGFLALKARRDKWFWIETTGLVFFWYWFAYLYLGAMPAWSTRISALLISHIVTSPLHVQIVLSHFAQSSEDLGLRESFASRQIRTTMDVLCPTYLDFLHGGLHMQVSHHLFPRIPRHNLRKVRDEFVRPFAKKWDLSYEEYTFQQGNGKVLKTLEHVANQVKILSMVASAQARGEIHH